MDHGSVVGSLTNMLSVNICCWDFPPTKYGMHFVHVRGAPVLAPGMRQVAKSEVDTTRFPDELKKHGSYVRGMKADKRFSKTSARN